MKIYYQLLDGWHTFSLKRSLTPGCEKEVEVDVELIEDSAWTDGDKSPERCLGRSYDDACQFREFPSTSACRKAGFESLGTNYRIA